MNVQEPVLRVKINNIDYIHTPTGVFDNTVLPRVPVIRIYGESSSGKKACVHVHQVYPYFFVEYIGSMGPEHVTAYITRLTHALNHAIAVSMKRNPYSHSSKFVRAIILVKGVHFYGFHSSYSPFLKVLIADPAIVTRAVTIMQSGTIMKMRFRVYESHLSYILQFLCDFGLYGCGWIDLAEVWQRGQDEVDPQNFDDALPKVEDLFKLSPYYRQTRMPLELDVAAYHILNRHKLSARNIHHKLTIPAPPLPPDPVVPSVRELWDDERQRRVARGLSPSPEVRKDPSEGSRSYGGEWVAEVRWWEEIRKRVEKEREEEFVNIVTAEWEKWVMTTFESVEALWEKQWRNWSPQRHTEASPYSAELEVNPFDTAVTDGVSDESQNETPTTLDQDVDENMLASQEISGAVEREQAEWEQLKHGHEDFREGMYEEDQAVEDGPLPELQYGEDSPSRARHGGVNWPVSVSDTLSKNLDSNHNPFSNAWGKLGRLRSNSVVSDEGDSVSRSPTLAPISEVNLVQDLSNIHPIVDYSPENPFLERNQPSSLKRPRGDSVLSALEQVSGDYASNLVSEELPKKRRRWSVERYERADVLDTHIIQGHNVMDICPSYQHHNALSPHVSLRTSSQTRIYEYSVVPPSSSELQESANTHGIPSKLYQEPYYSKLSDVPDNPREYAGMIFHLKGGEGIGNLEEWSCHTSSDTEEIYPFMPQKPSSAGICGWEYANSPPSHKVTRQWLWDNESFSQGARAKKPSQIDGPTQINPYGLSSGSGVPPAIRTRDQGSMSVLSLEVYAPSRGTNLPDPGQDEIVAVFYAFYDSGHQRVDTSSPFVCERGVVTLDNPQLAEGRLRNWTLDVASTELDLLNRVIDIVQDLDPDIVTGWNIQSSSWGYLSARAGTYELDISEQISRAPGRIKGNTSEYWGLSTFSTFKLTGRHVINLWRIVRSEQSLTSYTFDNVVFHFLRRRIPRYTPATLTKWYNSGVSEHVSRLLKYFSDHVAMVLELIDAADVVTKTAEYARVFGVDFFSVLTRGSQFKVESFMFRIAKPESFVLLSPSKQDVGKQNAAECMPLIMEPLSTFYNSPLVVLDFESLYPSIMIAYNYCYSTCLGRAVDFKGQNKFGVTELPRQVGQLNILQDHLVVSPNGMIYVKPTIRKGLLSRMLQEILDTRVMVKLAMNGVNDNKALRRVLDARQLSLKFIANVTYGYTSASLSGRMPAVEIADSIVQSGRETLEKAIRLINATTKWGARVVYGDTDSLFIYLMGKTKDQAFRIGHDIADTITKMNPPPVRLKFEKVYLPCVLMAKKRYVGFKYEDIDQNEPIFDAKGIETVRRDGIPAQQKMTENCLKILFRTQDLSRVKEYCTDSWARILAGKVSVQDFIFAKEVKLGTYSDKAPPPAGAAVAARRMLEDLNDEPQYGERIPYVIVQGDPGMRLVDRAVPPEELIHNRRKRLDSSYYISRVLIPPLERVFNLIGADVRSWYEDMPRARLADEPDVTLLSPKKRRQRTELANRLKIDEHFLSSTCFTCGALTGEGVCDQCRMGPQETISGLLSRIRRIERRLQNVQSICTSCSSIPSAEAVACTSLDCPWFYEREKLEVKAESLQVMEELIEELEVCKMRETYDEAEPETEITSTNITSPRLPVSRYSTPLDDGGGDP